MLQNPMVQNMMRNDPRFANNPMAQQMIQSLASNPEMLQQASQMMSDPNFQQHMQQLQQLQQNPALMAQQMQQMQNMVGSMPGGGAGTQSSSSSQPQNGQADEDLTEEEMIAEAIRRSLQDNGNNNN